MTSCTSVVSLGVFSHGGLITNMVACEQALLGALAAGREKERELATITLEFEFLHRKSHCKMLIGRDDISNDIITLGTWFSMFFFFSHSRSFPLRADGWKSDSSVNGEPQWKRCSCKPSFLFPSCSQSTLESLLAGY